LKVRRQEKQVRLDQRSPRLHLGRLLLFLESVPRVLSFSRGRRLKGSAEWLDAVFLCPSALSGVLPGDAEGPSVSGGQVCALCMVLLELRWSSASVSAILKLLVPRTSCFAWLPVVSVSASSSFGSSNIFWLHGVARG